MSNDTEPQEEVVVQQHIPTEEVDILNEDGEQVIQSTLLKRTKSNPNSPHLKSVDTPFGVVQVLDNDTNSMATGIERNKFTFKDEEPQFTNLEGKKGKYKHTPLSLRKESDISIDDSLKLNHPNNDTVSNSALELIGEEENGSQVLEEIGELGEEFKETPTNERHSITLPLGLGKEEFKTQNDEDILANNNNNFINLNNNNILEDEEISKPVNLFKNNSPHHSSTFSTTYSPNVEPFSMEKQSSVSELPYIRPNDEKYGGLMGQGEYRPSFNRSIHEDMTQVPLGDGPRTYTAVPRVEAQPLQLNPQQDAQEIPMVEINILPELDINGADPVALPARKKVDWFPIILCLVCFAVLVGVCLIIFFW